MKILSKKQIDEITEKYPLHSQDGKGLDAFVGYKLYHPDRRNNPVGYWYITGASRIDGDVIFSGLCRSGLAPGESVWPTTFSLSRLEQLTERGATIELDPAFKPATIRELYDTEPPVRYYVDRMKKEQARAKIEESKGAIKETIYRYFLDMDVKDAVATNIADALTDDVCKVMSGGKKDVIPALIHVIVRRLGL